MSSIVVIAQIYESKRARTYCKYDRGRRGARAYSARRRPFGQPMSTFDSTGLLIFYARVSG